MKSKKAEMGIGTLIIFISLLIVAAVAAGVLIQTSSAMQEQSLATGNQAKSQISTHAEVIDVSATDGSGGSLNYFEQIMKLSPGSNAIKLDQVILGFNTENVATTLKYRGIASKCERNHEDGFATFNNDEFNDLSISYNKFISEDGGNVGYMPQHFIDMNVDLDLDGVTDILGTCSSDANSICPAPYNNASYFLINLSNYGNPRFIYVKIVNDDGSVVDLDATGPFNFSNLEIIDNNGNYFGFLKGFRSDGSNGGYILSTDDDVSFEIFRPAILSSDLNDDGVEDFFVFNNTHLNFYLDEEIVIIPFGTDILTTPTSVYFDNEAIILDGETLGHISIDSAITTPGLISGTIFVEPINAGVGYFSAVYQSKSTNHVEGLLQRGDIVKLCYESFGDILADERIRLTFIPRMGSPILTIVNTPNVINEEKMYLYY
ncbi:MAG: archaellin/type IV pilin N-terminal domain-containing protein [Candidatus Woesearchaeota archaeon]